MLHLLLKISNKVTERPRPFQLKLVTVLLVTVMV